MKLVSEIESKQVVKPSWDWSKTKRVLIVRLRSIGDTVLATPALVALRRFLPDARIDIVLEDWVAPLLEDSDLIDNIVPIPTKNTLKVSGGKLSSTELTAIRAILAWSLRETKYDVAFNLHGGSTAGFFTFASGAKHRVGFADYRNRFFYNHRVPSSSEFWKREKTHSAEQQLALLGWTGVPVADKPKSRLVVTEEAKKSIENKLKSKIENRKSKIALIHPVSAFETKQWAIENFARGAEFLAEKGFETIAVAAPNEQAVLENLKKSARVSIQTFTDLSLPEITALASQAAIFVGNDSGIAHIAAAVKTPSVVIFGSSNVAHWRPWTDAPNEIVTENLACAPCAGYKCGEFAEPQCIRRITVERVAAALERVLTKAGLNG